MATLPELARIHTDLDLAGLAHVQRLVGGWGVLADLCFADLLLFVPVVGGGGNRFIVLGQVRPTTSQTLHPDDLVGQIVDESERPLVARAWRHGEIVDGDITVAPRGERARIQCIPVRWQGRIVAVLTRESTPTVGRRPGELERVYVNTFDRFARMIVGGHYPFPAQDIETEEAPRVGDGVLVLDGHGRVAYASPNAVNALHRMGVVSNVEGQTLEELGLDETAVRAAFRVPVPVTAEIERRPDVIVLLRCIPLLEDADVSGALVLLRDVTDLRRRDRLLLSKDAAIREVHHRVKNNLQTISSLLRLQARRMGSGEGRTALEEAERRIRSIGFVHEILSREASDQVGFNEIVHALVRVAEDGVLTADRAIRFYVQGDSGELPADTATPLAVVLTELLQNASEHAFAVRQEQAERDGDDVVGTVHVRLDNDGTRLLVQVHDDGQGLPDGFSIAETDSLGLSIVRRLVHTQLEGTIDMRSENGTLVELTVPLAPAG